MSIKDIKQFIAWVMQGDKTIDNRLELFKKQRENVQKQIEELQNTLDTINYKCWYYETAKEHGSTSAPQNMSLDELPKDIQKLKIKFDNSKNID